MQLSKNAMIQVAFRPASRIRDKFGQAQNLRLFESVPVRIERSKRLTRTSTGDFLQLDALMILEPQYALEAGDQIRIAWPMDETYLVSSASEDLNILGVPMFRRYGLVRVATPPPALTTSTTTTTTSTTVSTTSPQAEMIEQDALRLHYPQTGYSLRVMTTTSAALSKMQVPTTTFES